MSAAADDDEDAEDCWDGLLALTILTAGSLALREISVASGLEGSIELLFAGCCEDRSNVAGGALS